MSKAKAKADAAESASATATENAPEPRETPVKKRAVRRSSAAATSEDPDTAVASAPSAVATLPPAPAKAPKSRRKAAEDVEAATEGAVPAEAKPVRATRVRKGGVAVSEPESVPKAPARARKKVQTAAEIEQQELKFADEVAVAAGSAAPRKRTPRAAAHEQPVTPAQAPASAPTPAPMIPPPMPEVRDVPSYTPAPAQPQPAPDRPRKLDPEEEIAEAIAAQAEAKALHAEARARAAEAKAREAEARLRAVEARARATGIDPFADMDGESVVEKAPPMPGQAPRHDQPQNRPQHPQHSQHPRPQGQGGGGHQGGGGQQGGNQQGNNRGNRPETVYQGHGGGGGSGKSKRDKFEWKKNKGRKKPWEQRDRGPENRPGGAPGAPGGGNQLPRGDSGQPVETWRPGGDDTAAPAPVEARDRENDRDRDRGEGQAPQGRPERPERPQQPAEDRPVRDPEYGEGIIEISGKGKGFGFLRESVRNYNQSPQDVFVTPEIIRKYNLKDGMKIHGETRRGNRGPQLYKLLTINGDNPEKYRKAPTFEELTVINPMERLRLETVPDRYTTRVMDMMTPIGKGQRGLIVAPPRTGKTTMLQHIAEAITINYPDMPLILMLIDERPEEVTELRRALPKAEVIASSNDSEPRAHLRTAQLGIERAKRLVEGGHDVFMLLDSITRMGRAFNNAMHPGGKTGSGGIDSKAMEIPRKIFAAARNTEEAGSLTIIATALVETGSKGDEYIFQEFKGTGNMEVVLDRKISDQLVFPAIDIFQSGTRREELILPPFMLDKINTIRRGLAGTKNIDAISRLLMFLRRFPTNFELLNEIPG